MVLVLVDEGVVDELVEPVLDGVGVRVGIEISLGCRVDKMLGGWTELLWYTWESPLAALIAPSKTT